MNWVGAFGPQTVGGRQSHPPKAEKIWAKKINEKERRKAIRSAIAATVQKDIVIGRGHKIPQRYPLIIDASMDSLSKTKEVEKMLISLGFEAELERSAKKSIRAGMGKNRGRPYAKKKGLLIVTLKRGALAEAAKNMPGIDVVDVKNLNAEMLAPGAKPGRATIWSSAAISALEKEKLFA